MSPTRARGWGGLLRRGAPWWLVLLLASSVSVAAPGDIRRFPARQPQIAQLRIHGATDIETFAEVVRDYQRLHPGTEIAYVDLGAQDIYRRYLAGIGRGGGPDLLISSGMDLQTRLVNDGHALSHRSRQTEATPAWSRWRNEVFGVSYEPAVIVYNRRALSPSQVPRTHRQLLALLRDPKAGLGGRVGTYDVTRSSVGYLLATQDRRFGGMADALLAALGDNHVHLEERTGTLLDRVGRGELAMAYNVLGSYAQRRADSGAPLGIVWPQDYTLMLLRTALIPRTAANVDEARRFLDYLLSPRGQRVLAREVGVLPVRPGSGAPLMSRLPDGAPPRALRPIPLGPGLLVYLDEMKRRRFLEAWRVTVKVSTP